MTSSEPEVLLHDFLEAYRARSHAELRSLLLAPVATQLRAPSGKRYQVLVQAAWTGAPGAALEIVGGIDDGGWQRFTPHVESFVAAAPPPGAASREGDGSPPNAE